MVTRIALNRRGWLGGVAALASAAALPAAVRAMVATPLVPTPRQTAGPFYPDRLPAEHDWDLVRVQGAEAKAMGRVAHVGGRVLSVDGRPIPGALVEIWQCDAQGIYHHPRDRGTGRDPGFQGYGQIRADGDGAYRFRTIRPVAYGGRTPHIHVAVEVPGGPRLVTQMYVAGEPRNDGDFVLSRVPPAQRASVLVAFNDAPEIEPGALAGRFDIVLAG